MELAVVVLEYLRVLVWPLLIGGIIWLFRDNLSDLFERLIGLWGPGGGVQFTPPSQRQDEAPEERESLAVAEEQLPLDRPEVTALVEQAANHTTSPERRSRYLALELYYERIYRVIYRSQMEFLRRFERLGQGLGEADVSVHHQNHVQRAGPNASDQDAYLGFLQAMGLVEGEMADDSLRITWLGHFFLVYCDTLGYSELGRVW